MNFQLLQAIRTHELSQAAALMPAGCALLEIGAGAGWQAQLLAGRGFDVQAIDVAGPELGYENRRVWPVLQYDGHTIPFAGQRFDVVFSSNVLEHIPHLLAFQAEIKRVLKPGGRAIHIVPTGSWRFWTNLTYYPELICRYLDQGKPPGTGQVVSDDKAGRPAAAPALNKWQKLGRVAAPGRHGQRGNAWSEIALFSKAGWDRLFRGTGWRIVACQPNRLFYSGYSLLGERLSLSARRSLSRVLGSSCLIYGLEAVA